MAYTTRPHLPFTLIIPNPFKRYDVGDEKIRTFITPLFFSFWRIDGGSRSLANPDVSPAKGFFGKITDTGTVHIKTKNDNFSIPRIIRRTEFMKAARGELSRTASPLSESWRERYELQPYVAHIPAIPQILHGHLEKASKRSGGPLLKWLVAPGDWTRKGEPVAEFQAPPLGRFAALFDSKLSPVRALIRSPHSGVIRTINPIEYADWQGQTMDEACDQRAYPESTLFTLQVAETPGRRVEDHIAKGMTVGNFRDYLPWQQLVREAYAELIAYFDEHKDTRNPGSGGGFIQTTYMNEPGWKHKTERDPEIFARMLLDQGLCHVELFGDASLIPH